MYRKLALLTLAIVGGAAVAQDYPARPITIIVPFAAGGPTDTLTRNLGVAWGRQLKQSILVENVSGAGGNVGVTRGAKARPDGYTLLIHHIGMATSATLYRRLQYNALTDFEYIGLVADVPMTLIARGNFPANNFKEFLAYIRANRDKVTYANAGIGAASHLCGLPFMSAIKTQFIAG